MWAAKQAFLFQPVEFRKGKCLNIELQSLNHEAQSPLWPLRFEFTPWYIIDEEAVLFRLLVNGEQRNMGTIQMVGDSPGANPLLRRTDLHPQWPWILGLCCLMGDISSSIAELRLRLILDTLAEFRGKNEYIQKHMVYRFEEKLEISFGSLDDWMHIMYPVTGCIRSQFHPPCNFVPKRYNRLLKADNASLEVSIARR